MHPHEELLRTFLARLAAHDAAGMSHCYHPDVFYTNPLVPRARGAQAAEAWELAFAELADLRVQLVDACADADGGVAHWLASYTFRGRRVTHPVRSMFAFRQGLVCRHYDHFSLWRWCARALGPAGAALGWFGPYRWAVRQVVARRLERVS